MSFNKNNEILARQHVNTLRDIIYKYWIQDSIDKSVIYDGVPEMEKVDSNSKIKIINSDVIDTLFDTEGTNIAVLNFADYITPGGAFMQGGSAQEETICRHSTLYPVLIGHEDDYYVDNKKDINGHLYLDRALYSPDVLFIKNSRRCKADVITCAAPNITEAEKVQGFKLDDNTMALVNRIKLVLHMAADNEIQTLILGAWGCGVFGQDALQVARIFKYLISEYSTVENIIFTITNSKIYNTFKDVFENEDITGLVNEVISNTNTEDDSIIKVGDSIEIPRLIFGENGVIPEGTICIVTGVNNGFYDLKTEDGNVANNVML